MGKVVMLVIGTLLGLFVVFNFLLPFLAMVLKVALIIAVVALVFFIAVTIIGRSRTE